MFHFMAPSPNVCSYQGWFGPKSGAYNSVEVSHKGGRNPRNLNHQLLLSRIHINRTLEPKPNKDLNPGHCDMKRWHPKQLLQSYDTCAHYVHAFIEQTVTR